MLLIRRTELVIFLVLKLWILSAPLMAARKGDTKIEVNEKEVGSDGHARVAESPSSHDAEESGLRVATKHDRQSWRPGTEPSRTMFRPLTSFFGTLSLAVVPLLFLCT